MKCKRNLLYFSNYSFTAAIDKSVTIPTYRKAIYNIKISLKKLVPLVKRWQPTTKEDMG